MPLLLATLACSGAITICSVPAWAANVPGAVAALGVAGSAPVKAAVLARAVAHGEVLENDDLVIADRSAAQARGTLIEAEITGKETRRDLPAGSMVRASDLVAPRLVHRGEPVIITVRYSGLAIVSGGRALNDGGIGEMVRVVSTATNRTLDSIVEDKGAVSVTAP